MKGLAQGGARNPQVASDRIVTVQVGCSEHTLQQLSTHLTSKHSGASWEGSQRAPILSLVQRLTHYLTWQWPALGTCCQLFLLKSPHSEADGFFTLVIVAFPR